MRTDLSLVIAFLYATLSRFKVYTTPKTIRDNILHNFFIKNNAERAGFEPAMDNNPYTRSRRAP